MPEKDQILAKYRQQIDELDQQIFDLLTKRVNVVQEVGKLKEESGSKKSIIRPGREARMIRDMVDKSGTIAFPDAAIAQIWRTIIAGAINVEENVCVAVYGQDNHRESFWLAREYFGLFTAMKKYDEVAQVIESVENGEATIAVIPLWDNSRGQPWWVDIGDKSPSLKVFAKLPFLRSADSRLVPIVTIGNVVAEDSGDDGSLLVFKVKKNVSVDAIEPWLIKSGLKCYLQAVNQGGKFDSYLMDIDGFVTQDNKSLKQAVSNMAGDVIEVNYLGSYAKPLFFK